MPRTARKKTETGIYHIMLRGTDRRLLFTDDEDCDRFIDTLKRVKEISKFQLYAYCLMGNHVHLVLREGDEPLELVFKRLGASYAYYYNWKYQLQGHLFQDRFRSEPINDDAYVMDVLRYICQNPVKACLRLYLSRAAVSIWRKTLCGAYPTEKRLNLYAPHAAAAMFWRLAG